MRYLICLYINVIKYKIQIAVTMYITGCISFTFPEISFISTYTGIAIQIPFAMLFANIKIGADGQVSVDGINDNAIS